MLTCTQRYMFTVLHSIRLVEIIVLAVIILSVWALPAVAQQKADPVVDFQVFQADPVGKDHRRLAVGNLNNYFVEDVAQRGPAPPYDAATAIYTIAAKFNCKDAAKGHVFTDVTAIKARLTYFTAGEAPALIEATLTPNVVVGPCPAANPVMTGTFRIRLPRREAFSFWIDLVGNDQVDKVGDSKVARISYTDPLCRGFDPLVAPHALMLPLDVPASGPPKKRQATAVIDGALGNVSFSTQGVASMTQPPPPNYQPSSNNQTVEITSGTGAAAGQAAVTVTGRSFLGGGWADVGSMVADALTLRQLAKAKIAVFAVNNAAGEGPQSIPDFAAFATQIQDELNNKYFGLQANFFFKDVKYFGSVQVTDYVGTLDVKDPAGNLVYTTEEGKVEAGVNKACTDNGWACGDYPYRIYYVRGFSDALYIGLTFASKGVVFFRDISGDPAGLPTTKNTSAHEVGHLLGLPDTVNPNDSGTHLATDLMYGFRSVGANQPCDIRRVDWSKISLQAYANLSARVPLPTSLPELNTRAQQGDPDVVLWFGETGDVSRRELLRNLTLRPGASASQARMALARLGDRVEFDRIVSELESSDPWEQTDAIRKLGYVGGREATEVLIGLVDQESWRVSHQPSAEGTEPIDVVLHEPLGLLAMNALRDTIPNPPANEPAIPAHAQLWKRWWSENQNALPQRMAQ